MENMNNWQKIAAVYKKAAETPELDGRALELAVGIALADMVANNEEAIAAVTGDAIEHGDGFAMQLHIVRHEGNHYFLIFPDEKSAADMKLGFTKCSIREIFELAKNTPQMRGIHLIFDVDTESKSFSAGEITKNMLAIALDTHNN